MNIDQYTQALPQIEYFEKLPLSRRINIIFNASLIGFYYTMKFEWFIRAQHHRKISILRKDINDLQLKKLFASGAAGGFIVSKFTNPKIRDVSFHLIHSDIFALWINFLITADTAMDTKNMNEENSVNLLTRGLLGIYGAETKPQLNNLPIEFVQEYEYQFNRKLIIPKEGLYYPLTNSFRFENYSVDLAIKLGQTLRNLSTYHTSLGSHSIYKIHQKEFYQRTLELVIGQMRSLEQDTVDDNHDWGWYINVLNKKSLNVILAPFAIFTDVENINNINKSAILQKYSLLVNQLFFHTQVLDDLLDFESDIKNGIANTLIYMVVGQGRLAERIIQMLNCLSSRSDSKSNMPNYKLYDIKADILGEISRSYLLHPNSWAWRECKSKIGLHVMDVRDIQPDAITFDSLIKLVIYGLSNKPHELVKPLDELANLRNQHKQDLLNFWRLQNRKQVINIIIQSGIIFRILDSIADPRNMNEVQKQLIEFEDDELKVVFSLFYQRTMITYQSTLKKWRELYKKYQDSCP